MVNEVYPVLCETWEKVLYYRDNEDKLPALQKIADNRKKFYRLNTNFKVNDFAKKNFFMES